MALVPMKQILDEAAKKGYGVGAYNVNNMEQIQGIMQAARETQSPVILQGSRGALQYTSMVYLKHLMLAAAEENPDIPMAVHLDHGPDLETVKQSIAIGFTSVMIDGSLKYEETDEHGRHPARDFRDNIRVTREVVEYAHARGVSVEGELGTLGGIEDDAQATHVELTDPDQVEEFVAETKCDALAVAVGTSHGAYKFTHEPKLALDLIPKIKEKAGDVALVMHGSSSVPAELVDRINQYGGDMKKTMGVPMASLQEAIKLGVSKINVDTDGRLAVTGAIREFLVKHPEAFDPRKYLGMGRQAVYETIKGKMLGFSTNSHAGDYQAMSLQDMQKLYQQA